MKAITELFKKIEKKIEKNLKTAVFKVFEKNLIFKVSC